jgi:hypothetical protein
VAANGAYSDQPFYQLVNAVYTPLLNATNDYTINGLWGFTKTLVLAYDGTLFKGNTIAGGGALPAFLDPAQNSGLIRIVTVAPGIADGKPGDVWYVV